MEGLEILVGREHIDPKLLLGGHLSVARLMGYLNLCVCFAGMVDGKNVAACLMEEHGDGVCEVVALSVDESLDEDELQRKMLLHAMEYAKSKGFKSLDANAGNAYLEMHRRLQRMGFRVIGVVTDYYLSEGKSVEVRHSIVNRDMLHYRIDFEDGWNGDHTIS